MSGLCFDAGHQVARLAGVDCTRQTWTAVEDVLRERNRQRVKWSTPDDPDDSRDLPDGTGQPGDPLRAMLAKQATDANAENGTISWRDILTEEVCEAYAETDPDLLRAELIQVAAVAVKWVEAIDRRAQD